MTTPDLARKLTELREQRIQLLSQLHATDGAIQILEWQLAPQVVDVKTSAQVSPWPVASQSDGSVTYDQRPHV